MTNKEKEIMIAKYDGMTMITKEDYIKIGADRYKGENAGTNWGIVEYLKYTSSLDWIDPILKKIEKDNEGKFLLINLYLAYNSLNQQHGYGCQIQLANGIQFLGFGDERIDAIIEAVITYIEYYNSKQS